jgi:hypothetical protein
VIAAGLAFPLVQQQVPLWVVRSMEVESGIGVGVVVESTRKSPVLLARDEHSRVYSQSSTKALAAVFTGYKDSFFYALVMKNLLSVSFASSG